MSSRKADSHRAKRTATEEGGESETGSQGGSVRKAGGGTGSDNASADNLSTLAEINKAAASADNLSSLAAESNKADAVAAKPAKPAPYFAPNYKCLTQHDIETLQKSRVPIPDNEAERLFALRASELLDSDRSDPMFDRFTSLCQRLFDVPIVLVSLVDERRQWFKSAVGLEAPETHRDHAFCAYTVLPDR